MSHNDKDFDNTEAEMQTRPGEEEKEIDLLELASKLWDHRRQLIKWSIVGALVGLVVAFSIPKEYTTPVTLSPEMGNGSKSASGGIAAMAAMACINVGSSGSSDAVYPQLYPDVVKSVPFMTSLFNVPLTDLDGEKQFTLRQYMEDEVKGPWWGAVLGLPGKLIGLLKSDEEEGGAKHKLDNFRLTAKESQLVEALNRRITASVDAKTMVVTISVQMQDPLVSAIVADTVVSRLQEYIANYRTSKARQDLAYAEKLNNEAKENYYKAQQRYADYEDRNQGIALRSARTTAERLENETTLAFNLFNQTSQQVQMAKAKVQEYTPAYTVVTPPTVPVKATSPKKALILVGYTALAFIICAAWILFGKPMLEEHKKKSAQNKV